MSTKSIGINIIRVYGEYWEYWNQNTQSMVSTMGTAEEKILKNKKNSRLYSNDKKDVVIFATSNSIAVTATYQKHSKDCDCDRSKAEGWCEKENTLVDSYNRPLRACTATISTTCGTPTRAALKFKLTLTTSQGILIGRHFSEDQAFSRVVLKSTINALGQFQSLVEHPEGVSSMIRDAMKWKPCRDRIF